MKDAQIEQVRFNNAIAELQNNLDAIKVIHAKSQKHPSGIMIIAASPKKLPLSQYILDFTPEEIQTAADKMEEGNNKKLAMDLASKYQEHLDKVHRNLLEFRNAMRDSEIPDKCDTDPQSGREARETLDDILDLLRNTHIGQRVRLSSYLQYVRPEQLARDFAILEKQGKDLKECGQLGSIGELAKPFTPNDQGEIRHAARINRNCSLDIDSSQFQSYFSFFSDNATLGEKASIAGVPGGLLLGVGGPLTLVWSVGALVTGGPIPPVIALGVFVLLIAGAILLVKSLYDLSVVAGRHDEYLDRQYASLPALGA